MKQSIIIIFIVFLLFSCKRTPPEPTELYEKYRNSVVLIQNSYYFKTSLDNGLQFFYVMENNKPVFYDTEQEAIDNASVVFGTGFFISDRGEIATNRHVVYPEKECQQADKKIKELVNDLKSKIQKAINETKNEQSKLAEIYHDYSEYLDFSRKMKMKEEYSDKQNTLMELNQMLKNLEYSPRNARTIVQRVFLGIACDDTHVTSPDDFQKCVPIKKSEREDIDLAIIQLKDKRTPGTIANTFSLDKQRKIKTLKLNDVVYMIGFNHGLSLAYTENGIKSQFTQGTVTQDPDTKTILYSIPTLPGSSGSPIIDKWGNLVAINFAKTGDFQGFSFGIPAKELFALYDNSSSNTGITTNTGSSISAKHDYEHIIKDFLKAGEDQDFDRVYTFFSPELSRYYDMTNPGYEELKDRYEYYWEFVLDAKNHVKSIKKINEYTYDLKANYKYYNKKKQKDFSVNSAIRFLFDSDGKIIEIYEIK